MTKKQTPEQKAANKAKGIIPGPKTKYKKQYEIEAYKLCTLGAIDKDLADFFNVSVVTINDWKKKHPLFAKSIKQSKTDLNDQVTKSLFNRAMGYSHTETKVMNVDGKIEKIDIKRHYPPDTTSMIFWLKNREPENWRDTQSIEFSERPLVKITRKRFDGEDYKPEDDKE